MSVRRWPIKPPVHDSASARVMPRDLSAAPIRASSDSVMPSRLQEDPDCIPSRWSDSLGIHPHPNPPLKGEGGVRVDAQCLPPPSGSVDTARAALYPPRVTQLSFTGDAPRP